ncbi:MAG: hypothetical protein DPW12_16180 [Rhodocyclaceae bacterium]|nr:hypothetical protein [Rhodocyclaceae bacterium]
MNDDISENLKAASDALKRRYLRLASLIVGGASLAYLLIEPWLTGGWSPYLAAPSIFLLACLGALGLLRRSGVQAAAIILVYGVCAGALITGALIGSVRFTTIYSLIIAIGVAGWLLGPRHAVAIAALSSAGTLGIALAAEAGLLQTAPPGREVAVWVGLTRLPGPAGARRRPDRRAARAVAGKPGQRGPAAADHREHAGDARA